MVKKLTNLVEAKTGHPIYTAPVIGSDEDKHHCQKLILNTKPNEHLSKARAFGKRFKTATKQAINQDR